MRHFNALVFDENIPSTVTSTAPLYTSNDLNQRLGHYDMLAIQWVADNVSGGSPSLTVAIEHSADGRNWVQKNNTAEINSTGIASPFTSWGSDAGTSPSLGLVRLKIYLGGSTPVCHLKLYITARDHG